MQEDNASLLTQPRHHPNIGLMSDRLLLASASPRRRDLLEMMGLDFEVLASDTDESVHDGLPAPQRVLALAKDKAEAVLSMPEAANFDFILAADTLVWIESEHASEKDSRKTDGHCLPIAASTVFGKPANADDAACTLQFLSGRTHIVSTGLCLFCRRTGAFLQARSDSRVQFAAMSTAEIQAAVDNGDWQSVAGSYRIQGYAARFIEHIEGSWSGIVGLPIHELYVMLRQADFEFSKP